MKRTEAILAACMAISLAGCALRGAPKTVAAVPVPPKPVVSAPPAPPPQPLSIPQTNVELPKPQPLDPEALVTAPQPEPEPVPEASAATRSARRPITAVPGTVSNQPPRIETPAAPPQPEPERPPIQEIVPAAEQRRLQDSFQSRKADINRILDQITKNRRLGKLQAGVVRTIRSLVELADDAEKHGDIRQADADAERAQVLARELQGGK